MAGCRELMIVVWCREPRWAGPVAPKRRWVWLFWGEGWDCPPPGRPPPPVLTLSDFIRAVGVAGWFRVVVWVLSAALGVARAG